jgi:hypothetical protein
MFKKVCGMAVPKLLINQGFFTHNPLNYYKNSYRLFFITLFAPFFGRFLHMYFCNFISVSLSFYPISTCIINKTTLNQITLKEK